MSFWVEAGRHNPHLSAVPSVLRKLSHQSQCRMWDRERRGWNPGSRFLQGMDWELLASSVSTQQSTPATALDKYFLEFCRTGVSDRQQETLNHRVFSVTPSAFALEGKWLPIIGERHWSVWADSKPHCLSCALAGKRHCWNKLPLQFTEVTMQKGQLLWHSPDSFWVISGSFSFQNYVHLFNQKILKWLLFLVSNTSNSKREIFKGCHCQTQTRFPKRAWCNFWFLSNLTNPRAQAEREFYNSC